MPQPENTARRRNPTYDRPRTDPAIRFWTHVDKSGGEDVCWPFTGGKKANGYGVFCLHRDGPTWNAHRYAYTLAKGPIPEGQIVCHRCDNRPCCNPAHLFLGDYLTNSQDMAQKGRHPRIKRAFVRGVRPGKPTLTEEQVGAVRVFYDTGNMSLKTIAKAFGVTDQAIYLITSRKNWSHVA